MPRKNYPKNRKKTPYVAPPTLDIASTPYVACRKKRRFPTEKIAQTAADTQELTDFSLQIDIYRCQFCGGWHLTSRQKS